MNFMWMNGCTSYISSVVNPPRPPVGPSRAHLPLRALIFKFELQNSLLPTSQVFKTEKGEADTSIRAEEFACASWSRT